MLYKIAVLKNFTKFTGKHLCQSLLFNKVAGNVCNLIKKDVAQVFSCEFREIFKNTFFYHSHKKRKDSLEVRAVLLIFSLALEISGVTVQSIHQNREKE